MRKEVIQFCRSPWLFILSKLNRNNICKWIHTWVRLWHFFKNFRLVHHSDKAPDFFSGSSKTSGWAFEIVFAHGSTPPRCVSCRGTQVARFLGVFHKKNMRSFTQKTKNVVNHVHMNVRYVYHCISEIGAGVLKDQNYAWFYVYCCHCQFALSTRPKLCTFALCRTGDVEVGRMINGPGTSDLCCYVLRANHAQ